MKCSHCGHNSRYRERSATGLCPSCGKAFAFEKKAGYLLTDLSFKNAIDLVSDQQRVRWTLDHLYYDVCRAYYRRNLIVRVGKIFSKTVPMDRWRFTGMWERWRRVNDAPLGLILDPKWGRSDRALEPDLGAYSFDRVVVCDRPETVNVLLANNVHVSQACAVVSIDGYPSGPFDEIRRMLQRNPRLRVYALHDATPSGCAMATRLASSPEWFGGSAPVVDLGLRPLHARGFRGLLQPSQSLAAAGESVTAEEATWLSRYALELAAFRPSAMLRRLANGLNRPREEPVGGQASTDNIGWIVAAGVVVVDSESFGSDSGGGDRGESYG